MNDMIPRMTRLFERGWAPSTDNVNDVVHVWRKLGTFLIGMPRGTSAVGKSETLSVAVGYRPYMPPPTSADVWLTARRFGIVIDAGSSGSRLQIYSWRDARTVKQEEGPKIFRSLPKVEKGTRDGDGWINKIEPGISTFGGNPKGVANYLEPLLRHARSHVPPSLQHETPLYLLATAGMRLLPTVQQAEIMKASCDYLRLHSGFRLDDPSSAGPCGSSVRIISGEEEGLLGWISVNYLMDGFTHRTANQSTYGFLDMGGASTQIAFEPSGGERTKSNNLIGVRLRLLGGEEIQHHVFVTTWLGYGTNQARERYVADAVQRQDPVKSQYDKSPVAGTFVPDPCLPRDLRLDETFLQAAPPHAPDKKSVSLMGTGSFEQCLKQLEPLLNKEAPCPDVPCLFNGVHVPHIDFSVSQFIGVSEYWYSSEHIFGLGGAYDYVQYERAASEFCGQEWTEILKQHQRSKKEGHLGGDGEVDKDGRIIDTGKWGDKVEISRLQMQCFKSAWIINVLHEGLGMPRIVDPGGNSTSNADQAKEKANQKGLGMGRPTFQSADVIGDNAISWSLGKMILEASREVPPLHKGVPSLPDPFFDQDSSPDAFAKAKTLINFDAIEDHFAEHLPHFLTRHALGFSPLAFVLYVACLSFIIVVAYRLRRQILFSVRRVLRKASKRGDMDSPDQIYLEEGYFMNGDRDSIVSSPTSLYPSSRLPRSWLSSARSRFFHYVTSFRSRSTAYPPQKPTSRHMHHPPGRIALSTLSRSSSFAAANYQYQNGNGNGNSNAGYNGFAGSHGSDSPPVFQRDLSQLQGHSGQSLYSQSRSRNNSQLNLTTLITRQGSSRAGSGQSTPTGTFHDGD